MTFEPVPTIDHGYRSAVGEACEVIAQDENDETVELQFCDASVDELDVEVWQAMSPEAHRTTGGPERLTGSAPEDTKDPEAWEETLDWMTELERQHQSPG